MFYRGLWLTSVAPRVAWLSESRESVEGSGRGRGDLRRHPVAQSLGERSTGLMGTGISSVGDPHTEILGDCREADRFDLYIGDTASIGATLVPTRTASSRRDSGFRRGPTSAVPVALPPDSIRTAVRLRSSHCVVCGLASKTDSPATPTPHGIPIPHSTPQRPSGVLRASAVCPWMVHQSEAVPTWPSDDHTVCARVRA